VRIVSVVIAFAGMAACTVGRAAAPLPAPVAFLTDGLAAPYFAALRVARLTKICATKFSKQCRAQDVRQEDLESVDPAIFARVTVLGSETPKSLRFGNWEEFVNKFDESRDEFMRDYLAYEKQLIPKIGAIYAMCSESDRTHIPELLDTVRLVNFGRYWQLPADSYKLTMAEMDAAQIRYLAQIRKQWSQDQCIAAREFGFDLIRLFSSKLRLFLHDGWQELGKGNRLGAGAVSIWYFGMRAEGALHPEVFADALDNGPKSLH